MPKKNKNKFTQGVDIWLGCGNIYAWLRTK